MIGTSTSLNLSDHATRERGCASECCRAPGSTRVATHPAPRPINLTHTPREGHHEQLRTRTARLKTDRTSPMASRIGGQRMTATGIRMTADELLRLADNGMRRELIAGGLHEMPPAGGEHGYVSNRAGLRLGMYLEQHPEIGGGLFAAETGFRLSRNPDTVRAPDVAYVREERLLQARVRGFPEMAPDFVVEVVSPNDTASEIQAK